MLEADLLALALFITIFHDDRLAFVIFFEPFVERLGSFGLRQLLGLDGLVNGIVKSCLGLRELLARRVAGNCLGITTDVVVVHSQVGEAQRDEPDHGDHRTDPEAAVDALQGRVGSVVGAGLHGVGADDRAQHADAADQQGEDHALVAEAGHAQDHRGDDGDFVALEDVGGHAGAVAHVVAHVVGDRGRVAGIVLGDAGLDLAHQVGAHVGRLGVDAAADAHEQGQQRAAEAEAQQGLVGLFAVDQEDAGAAQQAQAVGQHAGDGAGAVAKLHGLAVAVPGGGGHAEVAGGGQRHAAQTDQCS